LIEIIILADPGFKYFYLCCYFRKQGSTRPFTEHKINSITNLKELAVLLRSSFAYDETSIAKQEVIGAK